MWFVIHKISETSQFCNFVLTKGVDIMTADNLKSQPREEPWHLLCTSHPPCPATQMTYRLHLRASHFGDKLWLTEQWCKEISNVKLE